VRPGKGHGKGREVTDFVEIGKVGGVQERVNRQYNLKLHNMPGAWVRW
jgi:hypothetical protein